MSGVGLQCVRVVPCASEARPKAHGKHKNSKKPHWFFGRLESFSRSHSGLDLRGGN